ncbi:hypothetical protein [Pseudoduganella namucuonensis]|uniref:Uncharacterized protein n=1 Tax=Pseudoduganella namucuonensis TaxID=1035707 RepID=A0A1I7M486_9BURK|nr:hypothetical protein [Pseudoduganella namucuonensis]SFV16630.1 hypothetical protein SAMN05216552_10549 [Pseudoduganella namucuonensis]
MTIGTLAILDQAELFQLALRAGAAGDSGAAIAYLKEAASRPDATGQVHYLLGAEYAQLRMYDRAAGELEAALALDPALATARLQLGLLWLGANDAERAATVLVPLTEAGVPEALRQFGAGLLKLIAGELEAARGALAQGIALNLGNAPLNADMQSIIAEIETRLAGGAPAEPAPAPAQPADDGGHQFLLSAYAGNIKH